MTQPNTSVSAHVGTLLSRAVVPLWVLTGAMFKLIERTPGNLPSGIVRSAKLYEIDLHILLAVLISLEFLAIAVMVFVPRFSRLAAIFMLSAFCLVLLNEMRLGNFKSCGCLGDIPIKPWQMLLIDATLLAGVILFRPASANSHGTSRTATLARVGPVAAVITVLVAAGASFGLILPERTVRSDIEPVVNNTSSDAPTVNPQPLAVPPSWYIKTSAQEFVGKPWRELELFRFMPKWPVIQDQGKHYVVFFSRTCEHCETMFSDQLGVPPYDPTPLDAPVTAIEIPASKRELRGAGAWEMPEGINFEILALPMGCDWIITPPLVLTIEDSRVTCAVEGTGYEACLGPN